ncbi:helix-turn-helix domain-containing protein [Saccharopolyspora spinosa]|uniref:Helix-turn-helix protein n=1 Tax=Saccharopolyspora spinosa TaxID=60894 RepID=A0A2N3XVV7_SACSN|nr:helix-turn-helix domain-containing protein [Saccharopolyspora spinosa]PKW14792.1 helix-turn-helix protein [Saccharopolyspora spinosa]
MGSFIEPGQPIGDRTRQLRGKLYTQRELADKAGLSVDLVRKLEQGTRTTASVASLHKLARALDVTLADLIGPARVPDQAPQEGAVELRHAVTDLDDLIGPPADVEPVGVDAAQRADVYAWGIYWSGDHDAAAAALPNLIYGLRAGYSTANLPDKPALAYALARTLWAAGSTLMHLRHNDAASAATRWAVRLAAEGNDPWMHATVQGSLAWQLMVAGRYAESMRLTERTAASIEPHGAAAAPHLSAYGSLLLQSGNAAARNGNAPAARDYLAAAADVAQRVGEDRNDYSTTFGPSLIAMQSADVHIALGDYDRAVDAAATLPNQGAALPTMARCRHLADRALAHVRLGQPETALPLMSTAVQSSPNWAKHQQLPKVVVRELLHTTKQRSSTLRNLASTLGVS